MPSPTFTLVQTYDETRVPVAHADLYRIAPAQELDELGLDDLLKTHVLAVEWPEKMLDWPIADRLLIELSGSGHREAASRRRGAWQQALTRNAAINDFLHSTRWRRPNAASSKAMPPSAATRRCISAESRRS